MTTQNPYVTPRFIDIIAAVSLPAYQDYVKRSQQR